MIAEKPTYYPETTVALKTWQISLKGMVQGVGFRPYVYQTAAKFGLNGTVSNGSDGLTIYLNATKENAALFYTFITQKAPALADIRSHELREAPARQFSCFSIIESDSSAIPQVVITPDLGICDACKAEVFDPQNRRYRYPFITCTQCGPRYSILEQLPYDRVNTTMHSFPMCQTCHNEYHDPANRRHFSQTNSCPDCGIEMAFYNSSGELISNQQAEILTEAVSQLKKGKILAVKGIGGFLLLCDATNPAAVSTLRKRKNRPSKPLAVLCHDVRMAETLCAISPEEARELTSVFAPIVLLKKKAQSQSTIAAAIAPGLNQLGVMLPYAPLLAIISADFAKPLVATSGNTSGSPIAYQNATALTELTAIADYILTHNRVIKTAQDDSVIRFTPFTKRKIILRRGRGYAPVMVKSYRTDPKLAFGADMKSTFAIQHGQNTLVSQYMGDVGFYDNQENFKKNLSYFKEVFKLTPELLLSDTHPHFFTHTLARQAASQKSIQLKTVQHHQAHLYAVLAENDQLATDKPVLGVIWDGTGLGDDGQIWGSEFFLYHKKAISRVAHLAYFPHILGDKLAAEPRIAAFCICENNEPLQAKFKATEFAIWNKRKRQSELKSSSMGRFFDAVASICGLADIQTFEGEAAMLLEAAATRFFEHSGYGYKKAFGVEVKGGIIDTQLIVHQLFAALEMGVSVEEVAARFHNTLVNSIRQIAEDAVVQSLAFSGGVFQNALLIDLIEIRLSQQFTLFFHRELSPNDENISFGQLFA